MELQNPRFHYKLSVKIMPIFNALKYCTQKGFLKAYLWILPKSAEQRTNKLNLQKKTPNWESNPGHIGGW